LNEAEAVRHKPLVRCIWLTGSLNSFSGCDPPTTLLRLLWLAKHGSLAQSIAQRQMLEGVPMRPTDVGYQLARRLVVKRDTTRIESDPS